MEKRLIDISDFKGGMSLNEKTGRKDQFAFGYGLDFLSYPGVLTCRPDWKAMALSSSVVLSMEFQDILFTGKDNNIYFGGEDTIIYKQTSTGDIASDHDSGQAGAIRSFQEFQAFMYYTQDTTIGRVDLNSSTYTDNWQTGLQSVSYHQQEIGTNGKLYIGNGRYLARWDGSSFTLQALDLTSGWEIRTVTNFGTFMCLGANYKVATGSAGSKFVLWNKTDPSWNDEIPVPEIDIKAAVYSTGWLWFIAGPRCALYVCNLYSRTPTKMWEFVDNNPRNGGFEVYPNSMKVKDGRVYFAISNVNSASSATNPSGLYSVPLNPAAFNINIEKYGGSDVSYKSIAPTNNDSKAMIYLSEKNGSNYRLYREKLYSSEDGTFANSVDGHIFQSFRYEAPPGGKLQVEGFGLDSKPLPSGVTLTLSYRKDAETSWTTVKNAYQTSNGLGFFVKYPLSARSLQVQLSLSGDVNATNRPYVKRIYVTGHVKDDTNEPR
jgi:hypothetical protein